MAKKSSKATRGDQYAAIMERDGFVPDEWHVLSFVFESESGPERFHYGLLLAEPAPGYYLFDCFDKTANVIVPHDDGNATLIQQLAESCGGEKTTPNLR